MTAKSTLFRAVANVLACALAFLAPRADAWQSDNGNETFNNPVLYADYPDPDICRVGNDFYMVSTTFVDSPGINVLHSKDLVNWEIVSHVASNLDGGNAYNMIGGTAYRGGFWASSIRYHNGTFYLVANPTFANSRIYYATSPAGPWQYYQLDRVTYDPSLLIDTDGQGYIIAGHGPESVFVLNSNYSQIVAVSNNVVNATGEGSHAVQRGNYYYLFTAYPGVWPYQLLCSRSTNIFGPYETNHVCLTEITGGHQGGIVDLPDGSDYGFVMKDGGAIGRMTYICPITWSGGWPVWGSGGQVPATATKPIQGQPVMQPATSDEFTNSTLGLQWQWNHNPDNTKWSLMARPGWLRLMPTPATNFWTARNTLTQKGQGPWSRGEIKLDISHLQPGDVCGFGTLGLTNGQLAVTCDSGGNKYLSMNVIVPTDSSGVNVSQTGYGRVPVTGANLYLRVDMDFQTGLGTCSYSLDGANWARLGGQFNLAYDIGVSTFQGEKYAIFCYNSSPGSGYVDVDWFHFSDSIERGRPHLNTARTTFVADNGQLLRGPFTSSEWTGAVPAQDIANMKRLGFNAVHLYAESFDPNYPNAGSTAPGYSVANVDAIVAVTRTNGMYLVITIGNGANNGDYNAAYITNFWKFYAARYANETHVLYEIQNEPVAWGPPYSSASATPPGALDMEIAAYKTIRQYAPNTPVLLFTYAVFGGTGGTSAALTDIHAFNSAVFGNANAVWTNEAVAFHGYSGWQGTSTAVAGLIAAGYPCMMTEFAGGVWGTDVGGLDAEMTSELERQNISWLTFQHTPPTGVSDDVSLPEHFKDIVDNSGLSWDSDYGNWPPVRGPYGNGGQPWFTATNWVNNFLTGTLRLQAEDFDTGGEGVAYHDTDAANIGGQYRPNEGVDIETTTDTGGGYDVTGTAAGEWLEYTIWVRNPGYYNLSLRYATPNNNCAVQALGYGRDKTGAWTLPGTGSYSTWQTAARQVLLDSGRQILRLNILNGGFNLNWMELSPISTGPLANGTYKFLNAANTLAPTGDPGDNSVEAGDYTGSTYQLWNLQHIGGGQYQITCAANGWGLTGGSGFYWWVNPHYIIEPAGGSYWRITSADSGSCLESVAGNPTNLDEVAYAGAANQQWAIVSPSAPAFPTGLNAVAVSGTQIQLTWNAVTGASGYDVKRSATSGGPYTILASGVTATDYTDSVPAGVKYYYVVSAVSSGVESADSTEAAVNLPYPWQSQDIGSVGISGNAAFGKGGFTVTASGADIWNSADAFRFAYVPVTGNCTIVARVTSVQNVDGWSKAGVMIRASLDAGSAYAFMAVTPGNGVAWQYRSSTGGSSYNNNMTSVSAPYWVKLVRSGNTFTGYRSPDGANWAQVGSTTISMAATVYAGLAVTAHNNSSLCAATFDNVTAPGWSTSVPPATPNLLTAAPWNAQVTLTWTASSGAASYNVKRSAADGGPYTVVANVATANYTDTGLTNGTTYYYVVSALNGAGESTDSTQMNATPEAFAPAELLATAVSPSEISLNWNAVLNATGYNLKRSLNDGGPYTNIAGGLTATNYQDTGLAGGTRYYYVVSAMVSGSETADSAQAGAATLSPTVGSLVHRYSFNETGGNTVADSVGGPVWNGTLPSGGTLAGGQLALASGAKQYVRLPTGIVASMSNVTVMAWVNLASVTYWSRIFDFGNDANSYLFLTPRNGFDYTARFGITISGAGGERDVNCPVAVGIGEWHQVAVTLKSGVGILYLDSVAVGTNANLNLNPAALGSTANNYLGRSQSGSETYLNGSLDEFRIYNAALTPAELAATYALGSGQLLSTNRPALNLALTGTNLMVTWPVANAGYTLQYRTNLFLGDWMNITSPAPQIVAGQWQAALPQSAAGSTFYRLTK